MKRTAGSVGPIVRRLHRGSGERAATRSSQQRCHLNAAQARNRDAALLRMIGESGGAGERGGLVAVSSCVRRHHTMGGTPNAFSVPAAKVPVSRMPFSV
jgi:hypothetical protein